MGQTASNRFEVREGISGTNRDEWRTLATFDTGAEAARYKEDHSPTPGHVFAVVKVSSELDGDPKWRERELERFASGRYKRVPWEMGSYAPEEVSSYGRRHFSSHYPEHCGYLTRYYPDHYAHVAESDATKVAFTESEEKGRKDIQKVMSVADYLTRFYRNADCDHGIIMHRNQFAEFVAEMAGANATIYYAKTADEIEEVYGECGGLSGNGGPCASCMGYKVSEGRYSSTIHPARVYAAGDLQLAYMRETPTEGSDEPGTIIARALVWPEQLKCGRIYGPAHNAFKKALRALGYQSPGDYDGLNGARLLKIPHNEDCNEWVMPYVDGSEEHYISDAGDHWIIDVYGDIDADSTTGVIQAHSAATCDHCDGRLRNGYVYNVSGEDWCQSCYDNNAFHCDHYGEYVADDEGPHEAYRLGSRRWVMISICSSARDDDFTEIDGTYYRSSDLIMCGDCEELFRPEDLNDHGRCESCQSAHDDAEQEAADSNAEAPSLA